jgi:hypothetical protein
MKKLLLLIALLPTFVFAQTALWQGGTGQTTSTLGDLLVGTSSTNLRYSKFPIGSPNYVLQASSTSPFGMAWVATSTLGFSGGGGSSCGSIGSAGTVQFASSTTGCFNGSSNLFWDNANGRLGIGTTTPTAKLDIWGSLNVGTSSTPTLFANTGTGRVGIAMTSPFTPLDVTGKIRSNRPGTSNSQYVEIDGGDVNGTYFNNVTANQKAFTISSLDSGGSLQGNGVRFSVGSTTNSVIIANFNRYGLNIGDGITGATATTTNPLDVHGSVAIGTYAGVNVGPRNGLIVSGNVGIGTSSPQVKLEVSSSTAPALRLSNLKDSGAFTNNEVMNTIEFFSGDQSAPRVAASIAHISDVVTSHGTVRGALQFNTSVSGAVAEAMRISSGGNVAIGTTTPLSILHVNAGAGKQIVEVNSVGVLSPLNLWNSNTGSAAGSGMLFGAGGDALTTGFIGGMASQRIDAAANSRTALRVLSNGTLSGTDTTSIFYLEGAATPKVIMNSIVGIGTTTPDSKLTVVGTSGSTQPILNVASSTNTSLFAVDDDGSIWFNGQAGTTGQVLQSFGATASPQWVATSSLGISGSSVTFVDSETPTGTVNGSNTAFTLANSPSPAASLQLFVNGQLMVSGGVDYTLSGANITMVTAPPTSSVIRAWYRR